MTNSEVEVNEEQPENREVEREETSTICVLHMLVPVEARRRAKLAAIASGLSFRDYVTHLFSQAQPFSRR